MSPQPGKGTNSGRRKVAILESDDDAENGELGVEDDEGWYQLKV